mmetsp:Transcript_5001/g.12953  ORF Transcript_5001/g.12953 Transcript_5001/m.12953 type:complete len:279 (-) Transcript_5001:823-1659(-)
MLRLAQVVRMKRFTAKLHQHLVRAVLPRFSKCRPVDTAGARAPLLALQTRVAQRRVRRLAAQPEEFQSGDAVLILLARHPRQVHARSVSCVGGARVAKNGPGEVLRQAGTITRCGAAKPHELLHPGLPARRRVADRFDVLHETTIVAGVFCGGKCVEARSKCEKSAIFAAKEATRLGGRPRCVDVRRPRHAVAHRHDDERGPSVANQNRPPAVHAEPLLRRGVQQPPLVNRRAIGRLRHGERDGPGERRSEHKRGRLCLLRAAQPHQARHPSLLGHPH